MVKEITDQEFEQEVLKSEAPVVVDFWAPWCGPCLMLAPVTEKLAEEFTGQVKFCKLNVEDNQKTAQKYQVMSIPLLLFFRNGERVDESLGALPEDQIRPKVQGLL